MRDDQTMHSSPIDGDSLFPPVEAGLGYVLYRSVARPGLERADLDRLLERSRDRNRALGLTGCLHHENGLFFQWLEGPRPHLFRLLDQLRDDDRHIGFTVLDQGPLSRRLFQHWDMRFSDAQAASLLDWLAARSAGEGADTAAEAKAVGGFLASLGG